MTKQPLPRVLAFDVFGTVFDWRTSIIAHTTDFLEQIGHSDLNAASFTDDWRRRYLSGMRAYATSGRGFVPLDQLHREMLEEVLRDRDIDPDALGDELLKDWAHAWRRLTPWSDSVAGLARLKRAVPIVTLSNGNIALMLELARYGGLPWDAILGAELTRAYKPDPRAYIRTAEILDLPAAHVCLVAAHHSDLAAARACGLATAFVARPMEYGGRRAPDADARQEWEWTADSLTHLADLMGC